MRYPVQHPRTEATSFKWRWRSKTGGSCYLGESDGCLVVRNSTKTPSNGHYMSLSGKCSPETKNHGGLFFFFRGRFWIVFGAPGSMLSCFSDFLLFCFSAFLLLCFSCFSAFCLPCFSAFCFSYLCFSASLFSVLLCFCTSAPFYFYYSAFSFLQSCVFAAPLPAPLLLCFLSLLSLCFSCYFAIFCSVCILNETLERP